jgi:hypothetical protein
MIMLSCARFVIWRTSPAKRRIAPRHHDRSCIDALLPRDKFDGSDTRHVSGDVARRLVQRDGAGVDQQLAIAVNFEIHRCGFAPACIVDPDACRFRFLFRFSSESPHACAASITPAIRIQRFTPHLRSDCHHVRKRLFPLNGLNRALKI